MTTATNDDRMPNGEKIAYICLVIILLYVAIKTGIDLHNHYTPTP
jgi:hypothetical protein